ncbi:MAG TPA: hypothetical protein PK967_07815 [Candidatus Hydrogenedentes bacterium]|nr:hypothetical protein [Candidatus Hydrogenedentota bacterium]
MNDILSLVSLAAGVRFDWPARPAGILSTFYNNNAKATRYTNDQWKI